MCFLTFYDYRSIDFTIPPVYFYLVGCIYSVLVVLVAMKDMSLNSTSPLVRHKPSCAGSCLYLRLFVLRLGRDVLTNYIPSLFAILLGLHQLCNSNAKLVEYWL